MERKLMVQEYYALTVDQNGNMPSMRADEANAGLVAAGFMDLLFNEIIVVEKKKIMVKKDLSEEFLCLTSLYEYLEEKPRSIEKLMSDYYTGRKIKQLTAEVGSSLYEMQLAQKGKGGLFGSKITYIPEKNYKDDLVQILHTLIKMENAMTPHDITLLFILNKTKNLKQYFSKYENDQLKRSLKEIKKHPQNKKLEEMIDYMNDLITVLMCAVIM